MLLLKTGPNLPSKASSRKLHPVFLFASRSHRWFVNLKLAIWSWEFVEYKCTDTPHGFNFFGVLHWDLFLFPQLGMNPVQLCRRHTSAKCGHDLAHSQHLIYYLWTCTMIIQTSLISSQKYFIISSVVMTWPDYNQSQNITNDSLLHQFYDNCHYQLNITKCNSYKKVDAQVCQSVLTDCHLTERD